MMAKRIRSLLVMGALAMSMASAYAQNAAPCVPIEIDVFDQSGAVIPNAQIKLTDSSTKTERQFETDSHGTLRTNVQEGLYYVETSSPGFVRRTLTLEVRIAKKESLRVFMDVANSGVWSGPVSGTSMFVLDFLERPKIHTVIKLELPALIELPRIKLPRHRKLNS